MKKWALITGASSGIGAGFAQQFAKDGHNLILVARSEGKLNSLASQLSSQYGVTARVIASDLGQPGAAQDLFDQLQADNIPVEFLVNNAGFGDYGFFHETNWDKEAQMMNLNMLALAHLTKLFGSEMVRRRSGRILNVASTAAFQPGPLMAIYYSTKHFVLSFSEAIANEWKDFGVTVTALCPGPTESGFQSAAEMEDSKLVKGKKMPTSEEVAAYGYRAMFKGKTVAVHGFMNRVMAFSTKFMPRKMLVNTVRKMQERSH